MPPLRRRFRRGDLKNAAPKGIEPVITVSAGTIKQVEILYVEPLNGYRILFDWYPTSDAVDPVDMRLFLRTKEATLSETALSILPAAAGPAQVR